MKNGYIDYIEYDYNTTHSCNKSGCVAEGICRCGKIINEKIIEIDIISIGKEILKDLYGNNESRIKNISSLFNNNESIIDEYCINRILVLLGIQNGESWEFEIERGFYGELISNINVIDFYNLSQKCTEMFYLPSIEEKIKYVLMMEYGHIPKCYNFNSVDIDIFNKSDLISSNENHSHLVGLKDLSFYYDDAYQLPRGIVKKVGKKYRIVDGHHRIQSSSIDIVEAIEIK